MRMCTQTRTRTRFLNTCIALMVTVASTACISERGVTEVNIPAAFFYNDRSPVPAKVSDGSCDFECKTTTSPVSWGLLKLSDDP